MSELVKRKVLPPGKQLMSMLVEFEQGGIGPEHAHPHEQLSYIVTGKIQLTLNEQVLVAVTGDQIWVPSNTPHSIIALEDSLLLETFTPLREDLLESIADYQTGR
ncbi:cupin domain-containing protein [Cohnella endophytica]|uniref:cupin domain-containing protein n=1 Tax=Cohnella endophytica TaxID=2419778 RepID=UPI001F30AA0E|nr:cupin domain-containing protein [Cohnella endophytica]